MTILRYSPASRRDLASIYAYTSRTWGEWQADSYLDDLKTSCERIADGSASIRRLTFRSDAVFKLKQGWHLTIFRHQTDASILIIRVLHERMDIEAQLGR